MTNKAVPLASIVSLDDVEEEQTRIFSRAFVDYAARQQREPTHRYVAIAIPAFPEASAPDGERSPHWLRAATAMMWGCSLTIIGTAAVLAYLE